MGLFDRIKAAVMWRSESEHAAPEAASAAMTTDHGRLPDAAREQPGQIANGWTEQEAEELSSVLFERDLKEFGDAVEELDARLDREEEVAEEAWFDLIDTGKIVAFGEWQEHPASADLYRTAILKTSEGWHFAIDSGSRSVNNPHYLNWSPPYAMHKEAEQRAAQQMREWFEEISFEAEMFQDEERAPRMELISRGDWTRPHPAYEQRESILRDDQGYWCEIETSHAITGGDDFEALYGPFGDAELAARFGGISRDSEGWQYYPIVAVRDIRDTARALIEHPGDKGLQNELKSLVSEANGVEEVRELLTDCGAAIPARGAEIPEAQLVTLVADMDRIESLIDAKTTQREKMVQAMALERGAAEAHICHDEGHEEVLGRELGR